MLFLLAEGNVYETVRRVPGAPQPRPSAAYRVSSFALLLGLTPCRPGRSRAVMACAMSQAVPSGSVSVHAAMVPQGSSCRSYPRSVMRDRMGTFRTLGYPMGGSRSLRGFGKESFTNLCDVQIRDA